MTDVPYLAAEHPIRFAHRGSRLLWPENTMRAFSGAVEDHGYRYLELDVRCSADGVPMVFHDQSLERTSNGAGPIAAWSAADLATLDAGYHFAPGDGHPLRGAGITIPTLEELLRTWPDVRLNIDLKAPGIEWQVAEVIRRCDAEERILIGSFYDQRIARFRRITRERVAVSAGPTAAMAMYTASRVGRSARSAAVAFQLPYRFGVIRIDRRLIAAVHRAGAQLHVWTVNEPADMRRLLDMGVDGIVTDRPDLLNDVLAEREEG